MSKSIHPLWWSLFGAGGTVAALLVPVHILLTGIALPAGWLDQALSYERLLALVTHPLARLYLFVLISLPLFHWAHRFRYVVHDLGLKGVRPIVAVASYGGAIAGSLVAAFVLITL